MSRISVEGRRAKTLGRGHEPHGAGHSSREHTGSSPIPPSKGRSSPSPPKTPTPCPCVSRTRRQTETTYLPLGQSPQFRAGSKASSNHLKVRANSTCIKFAVSANCANVPFPPMRLYQRLVRPKNGGLFRTKQQFKE